MKGIELYSRDFDGMRYRLLKDGKFYFVTTMPQLVDGSYSEDEEITMGGYPGSNSTDFDNLNEAKNCFVSLVAIGNNEEKFWDYIDAGNNNFPLQK